MISHGMELFTIPQDRILIRILGANGCDSSMTLNLTINNSSAGSVDITACDNFTWDGVVYDSTGSYTNTYLGANGCDSLMTLNLTINNSSAGSVDITACDNFTWDGVVYDSTGSYTNTCLPVQMAVIAQ